jgi:CHAT domain-containing protein
MSSQRLDKASESLRNAIDTIEHLRTMVAGSEREQQIFLQERIEPYYAMIELSHLQNNNHEALAYAERAKARVLMDVLQSGRTNITKTLTDEERRMERQLKNNLAALNLKLTQESQDEKGDEKKISDLQSQLQKARYDFEAFQTTLYTAHPDLKVHRGEIADPNNDVNKFVSDQKTAFLEYAVTGEKLFLFVVISSALESYEIKVSAQQLNKTVLAYREQIANRNPAFRNTAKQLYNLLLSPALPQLKEIQNTIIIPDGILWELPFQALISGQDRFFLQDVAVSYAPSINALREMEKIHHKNPSNQTVLAFANPAFGKDTTDKVEMVFRGIQLHPLPEAEFEVKKLRDLYGPNQTSIYFGPDATESVLKREIGKHEIIHLATHGILNRTNPMYSHLVFSHASDNDPEDGLLEAWEIMKMNLNARLVILSACETARGKIGAGEGMIGLNWAFFVAGCPATVVSQWKVESKSTADLMYWFHQNLKNRIAGPQALQQAALTIMKNPDYRHPFYWASFIFVGDPS